MNNLNAGLTIDHKKRQSNSDVHEKIKSDIVKKYENINSIQFKEISKLESYFKFTNGSYIKNDLDEIEKYINSRDDNNNLKKLYTFISENCDKVDFNIFVDFVQGSQKLGDYNLMDLMERCVEYSENLAYDGLDYEQTMICRGDSDYTLRFLYENRHYDEYYLIKFLELLGQLY